MDTQTLDDIIGTLAKRKEFLHENLGVIRLGVFGSFVQGTQKKTSDIDIVVEFEKNKKNLHNFLKLKRMLEHEINIRAQRARFWLALEGPCLHSFPIGIW